jgi:hypothetical protein
MPLALSSYNNLAKYRLKAEFKKNIRRLLKDLRLRL